LMNFHREDVVAPVTNDSGEFLVLSRTRIRIVTFCLWL
jgi:hypothetical protein